MKKIFTSLIVFMLAASLFVAFSPSVYSQTGSLEVRSYSWYTSPLYGYFVVVGEVQNTGTDTVQSATLTGLVYTKDQVAQASNAYSLIYATQILPNDTAPFFMYFTEATSVSGNLSWIGAGIDRVEFSLYVNSNNTQKANDLHVIAHEGHVDSSGNYTVTGIVLNRGNEYPENIWVVGAFYNSSGSVVAVGFSNYLTHYLPPNNYTQFSFKPSDPTSQMASQITSYTLHVLSDGSTAEPTPTPTISTSPTTTANPSQSPSQTTPSETDSTPSSTTLYIAIAAIAVIAALIVLVLVLRRRRS